MSIFEEYINPLLIIGYLVAVRGEQGGQLGQDQGHRDEGDVTDDQVEAAGRQSGAQVGGIQRAAIDAFQRGNARVGAQPGV